jgi:23S rRNA (cytosine1962-C5)-methyltransferase
VSDLDPDLLARLPRPAERNVTLRLARGAEGHVRRGHPWVFDRAIEHQSHEGAAGDLAVLFDHKRALLALGLYDPTSPIRVRVLQRKKPVPIDEAFFARALDAAIEQRAPLLGTDTDGYRVVHGENDGLPGLVVDRYADTLVVKLYSLAWFPRLRDVLPPLHARLAPRHVVLRQSRAVQLLTADLYGLEEGQALTQGPLTTPVVFKEEGLRFEADPVRGQKTGFFLDQRENRALVERKAQGRRVLNAFAYSGGFSLYAARGGAVEVVSLDSSGPALAHAARNFELNQDDSRVAACKHELLCEDAFAAFERLAAEGRRFDLVIIDPPAFAKRQEEVGRALASYGRLVRLGLGVLKVGGELVMASCSSRVSVEDLREVTLQQAKAARRALRIELETAHALDHPIGFSEGAYLKCLFASA